MPSRSPESSLRALHKSVRGLFTFEGPETFAAPDHDLAWSSLSRIEHIDDPTEFDQLSLSSGEHPRPVIGGAAQAHHPFM